MRRKSFDVLFETKTGMAELALNPTLWRSLFYFTISLGSFIGVCTNVIFSQQTLGIRFAVLVGILVIKAVGMTVFGCFLHGLIDAFGGGAGNVRGLLCILGFTALPFLVLTPAALLGVKLGGLWLLLLPLVMVFGGIWCVYLIIRAVEAVYLINFGRAAAIVVFGFSLWLIIFLVPLYMFVRMLALSFF
ncbi:hypothetical protein SDC9_40083 [bioreactor metagenome]|uniref:Yip1 domain-containing protein n=1 Tax=bioreactor metagenome TaxID=1076179 RepID=A0A644VRC4_9ZZZZ|nr:YIP1 family protein [Acidaminococcaceae bacterium]